MANHPKNPVERAQEIVGAGNPLADLFLKPTKEAREFLATLTRRERLALEARARPSQSGRIDVC